MRASFAIVAGLVLSVGSVHAQDFPTRPVTFVVPQSPAGITDIAARVIGDRLSTMWGKRVVVENKPGGGGTIGVLAVARAAPDGYTLLLTTNGELALNPVLHGKPQYDPPRDFAPVAMVTNNPMLFVANVASPYKSVADVAAAAKAKPGEIGWASPGNGTWPHLTGEWLTDALGIKLLHVPYKGGGPAGVAVAGGEVPLGMVAISSAMPHIVSGRMSVLALTSGARSSIEKSWPTVAEGLVPGFDSMQWVGLFAPAGIDRTLLRKIETDVLEVLNSPDIRERFFKMGVEVIGKPGTEATRQLESDRAIAERIVDKAKMKIE